MLIPCLARVWTNLLSCSVFISAQKSPIKPRRNQPFSQLIPCLPRVLVTATMTRTKYKNISPAKKIRSLKRLATFRHKKMSSKIPPSLSIQVQEHSSFIPTSTSSYSKSLTIQTSYPEPCILCRQFQCEWNQTHDFLKSVSEVVDATIDRHFQPKKPPDDQ